MRSFGESVVYIYLYIYRDVFIYMYICVRFVFVYGSNRDEHCRDDVSFVCFILLLARVGMDVHGFWVRENKLRLSALMKPYFPPQKEAESSF